MTAPLLLAAAGHPKATPQGETSSAVSTFTDESAPLLLQLKEQATNVRDLASKWQSYNREPFAMDWRMHAYLLNQMRRQVNALGTTMMEIQNLPQNASAQAQQAMGQIAPRVVEISNTTQNAMDYLRDNHDDLFNPTYTSDANFLLDRADQIIQSVDDYEQAAGGGSVGPTLSQRP